MNSNDAHGDKHAKKDERPTPWKDIPLQVFEGMREKFGEGEEYSISTHGSLYRVVELHAEDPEVGFPGAIGFRTICDQHMFVLWGTRPRDAVTVRDSCPLLEIAGGMTQCGVWAFGQGNLIQEYACLRIPREVGLESPAIGFIGVVLSALRMFVKEGSFTKEVFWESEKRPGAYDQP